MDMSKLDPNVVVSWLSALGGLALWLWHKAHGEKTADASDILDSLVTQIINTPGVDLDNVRARIETKAREALAKIGLKGAAADMLVHKFAEYGLAKLHEKFDLMQKSFETMVKKTIAVGDALEPPKEPTVPVLDLGMERVP